MRLDFELLDTLELSLTDLDNLTEEEKKAKIRKQYWRLALQYHPDRGGDEARFKEIATAYGQILSDEEADESLEINRYFTVVDFNLPDTAFDLLSREAIDEAYEGLLSDFRILASEEEKYNFARQNASFISLAQLLKREESRLNGELGSYFLNQLEMPVWQSYQHEWRKLMLSLFAEEYLDDFQYRNAIVTGELWSLLATRKLLSPVKLLVALLNSIILGITVVSNYLFAKKLIRPLVQEFSQCYNDFQQGNLNIWAVARIGIKIMGLIALVTLPLVFFPLTSTLILSIPLAGSLLTILACPVNRIVRPLSQYTGLSPYVVNAALVIGLGVSAYLFINFFPITVMASLLTPMSIALTLYMIYGVVLSIKKLYEINPSLALFQLIYFIFATAVGLLAYFLFPIDTTPLTDFLINLIGAIFIYQENRLLDNYKQDMADQIEMLPLPQEEIPEDIKDTVLQKVKTGHYSSKFFHTPKDAAYIPTIERTVWQQAASFFGGGQPQSATKATWEKEPILPYLALEVGC
ncbi:J domain-containing protein [Legionella drozanskii]|uniref:Chaperone protein DnaJ n=1 Tax=Legionella drozanskii LLAP-1 TaxID=1212489 RepID=A0A0W0SQM8_9GAMM|nr:J domain-containing protein [Legionella drozanskii]KTC85722.1 chaperone protein DnaJ [Legionella drozanskii LLAP-1]